MAKPPQPQPISSTWSSGPSEPARQSRRASALRLGERLVGRVEDGRRSRPSSRRGRARRSRCRGRSARGCCAGCRGAVLRRGGGAASLPRCRRAEPGVARPAGPRCGRRAVRSAGRSSVSHSPVDVGLAGADVAARAAGAGRRAGRATAPRAGAPGRAELRSRAAGSSTGARLASRPRERAEQGRRRREARATRLGRTLHRALSPRPGRRRLRVERQPPSSQSLSASKWIAPITFSGHQRVADQGAPSAPSVSGGARARAGREPRRRLRVTSMRRLTPSPGGGNAKLIRTVVELEERRDVHDFLR